MLKKLKISELKYCLCSESPERREQPVISDGAQKRKQLTKPAI